MSRRVTNALAGAAFASLLVSGALIAQTTTPVAAPRLYVTAVASSLVSQGLALAAPTGAESAAFQTVASPGVRNVPNEAMATSAAWIDSNASRFQRDVRKANYANLLPGAAPVAAAEAFAYGVDAIVNPPETDVQELGNVLQFLKAHARLPMPGLANVGVVDNGSPFLPEALNLLTRRNILYRVVAAPDRALDLNVEIGSAAFPIEAVVNPSDFAARVRAELGDDKRLVRLYGSTTVIARLTGADTRARLVLLNFSRSRNTNNAQPLRVRVLGQYQPVMFAAYGAAPGAALEDVENPAQATEFTVPFFSTIAIVDLDPR
jgi:hypothetical protein